MSGSRRENFSRRRSLRRASGPPCLVACCLLLLLLLPARGCQTTAKSEGEPGLEKLWSRGPAPPPAAAGAPAAAAAAAAAAGAPAGAPAGVAGGGPCRPPSPETLWYAQRLQALAELVNLPLTDWSPLTAVLRLTLQLAFAAGAILGSLLLFFYFLADNVYALVCLFAWSLLLDRLFMRALAQDGPLPFLCLTTGLLILRLVLFLA